MVLCLYGCDEVWLPIGMGVNIVRTNSSTTYAVGWRTLVRHNLICKASRCGSSLGDFEPSSLALTILVLGGKIQTVRSGMLVGVYMRRVGITRNLRKIVSLSLRCACGEAIHNVRIAIWSPDLT